MTSVAYNLVSSWLAQQCEVLDDPIRAVVLLGSGTDSSFQPAAVWPESAVATPALLSSSTHAIRLKQPLVFSPGSVPGAATQDGNIIAVPVVEKESVIGVVAVELEVRGDSYQDAAKETLKANVGTLKLLARPETAALDDDAPAVLDLVATCLEKPNFDAAARALLARFAAAGGLKQASIGMLRKGRVVVEAVSGRSTVEENRDVHRSVAAAMSEAIEFDQTIVVSREGDETAAFAVQNNALLDAIEGRAVPFDDELDRFLKLT